MDEPVADLLRRCRPILEQDRAISGRPLIDEIDSLLALHSARRAAAARLFQAVREAPAIPFVRKPR